MKPKHDSVYNIKSDIALTNQRRYTIFQMEQASIDEMDELWGSFFTFLSNVMDISSFQSAMTMIEPFLFKFNDLQEAVKDLQKRLNIQEQRADGFEQRANGFEQKFQALDSITTVPFGLNAARQLCIYVHQSYGEDPFKGSSYENFLQTSPVSLTFISSCLNEANLVRKIENLRISRNVAIHNISGLFKRVTDLRRHGLSVDAVGTAEPIAKSLLENSRPLMAQICAAVVVNFVIGKVRAEGADMQGSKYFSRCMTHLYKAANDSQTVPGLTLTALKQAFFPFAKQIINIDEVSRGDILEMLNQIAGDDTSLCPANANADLICRHGASLMSIAEQKGIIEPSGKLNVIKVKLSRRTRKLMNVLRSR